MHKISRNLLIIGIVIVLMAMAFLRVSVMTQLYSVGELQMEFYGTLLGTIITAIVTVLLLKCQTEIEEGKDIQMKIFEKKQDVYFKFIDTLEEITTDGEIETYKASDNKTDDGKDELQKLMYQLAKLQMTAKRETTDAVAECLSELIDAMPKQDEKDNNKKKSAYKNMADIVFHIAFILRRDLQEDDYKEYNAVINKKIKGKSLCMTDWIMHKAEIKKLDGISGSSPDQMFENLNEKYKTGDKLQVQECLWIGGYQFEPAINKALNIDEKETINIDEENDAENTQETQDNSKFKMSAQNWWDVVTAFERKFDEKLKGYKEISNLRKKSGEWAAAARLRQWRLGMQKTEEKRGQLFEMINGGATQVTFDQVATFCSEKGEFYLSIKMMKWYGNIDIAFTLSRNGENKGVWHCDNLAEIIDIPTFKKFADTAKQDEIIAIIFKRIEDDGVFESFNKKIDEVLAGEAK